MLPPRFSIWNGVKGGEYNLVATASCDVLNDILASLNLPFLAIKMMRKLVLYALPNPLEEAKSWESH